MIETALIIMAAVVGLSVFWSEVVNFLKDTVRRVKEAVEGILFGTKVFVRKMHEMVQEIVRHYSKSGNEWIETTYTRKVPPDEVPSDILKKAKKAEKKNEEADITQELEMELKGA